MNEDIYGEIEIEEVSEDPKEFAATCEELENRCKAAKIELTKLEDPDGDISLYIDLPCGREKRRIFIYELANLKNFLKVPFEKYIFLGNYLAICSYTEGIIEATFNRLGVGVGPALNYRRFLELFFKKRVEEPDSGIRPLEFNQQMEGEGLKLSIAPISYDLRTLCRWQIQGIRPPCLRIEGVRISQHDQALSLLERISYSFFFQIDMALNMPLGLQRQRRPRPVRRRGGDPREFQSPKNEYDKAPMALYWYARSAAGMPLLQFLAYYQCIEYYFPTYSEAEARRKISNILKDPIFRADRSADIGRILSAIKSGGSIGYGDERNQLRATLQECIDQMELREFLTFNPKRSDFFSTKTKGLSDYKISINDKTADLRNDVANRIYDIRCKIVHTKSGGGEGEIELLLPFSKEADLLDNDIELIQYLAQRVLIAASSPLKI